ncbi:MAG: hypothetical protein ABJG78_19065 [Cyclobacteriaceae bacterium]
MRILSLLIFLCAFTSAFTQSNQSEYLEAKRQFGMENYRDAMGSFQSLTNDPVFGAYASFYYGLSAYHQQVPVAALSMWKQILQKYPKWDRNEEVNFWISKLSFEKKRYLDGVKYAEKLPLDLKKSLLITAKNNLDLQQLDQLYEANQGNELLAALYFQALTNQTYEERDHEKLLAVSEKFNFDAANFLTDMPKVEKEKYGVALVLPFMFDSLQNPQSVIRNSIIFDLYQGMMLARDSLDSAGISLELFPYDTKKLGYKAGQIVNEGLLDSADLIIGPLYSEPNEIIGSYSKRREIPIINPLSSNGEIIADNRLAYLFKPSYETQGKKAGEYAAKKFTKNKRAMIFFESGRDLIIAEAYKKVLEEDSFDIVLFDELDKDRALQLQVDFTEQYESILDTLGQEAIDSIMLIPNRYVRTRVKKDTITGRPIRNLDGEDELQYYEMRYTIPQDTIGHIFAATSNNLLANNIISLTDVRGDSIGVVGYSEWLDFKLVSYSQLERLNVSLINTSYFKEGPAEKVREKIRKKYWTEASEYHLLGFELIMHVGNMFAEHGKYFQRGLLAGEVRDGYLMEGLTFGSYKDNQIVPIITIKDLNIVQDNYQNED